MISPQRFSTAFDLLHETATAATDGLHDFGVEMDDYREGLTRFLHALDENPITPFGREHIAGALVGSLSARLLTQKGWDERPDSLKTKISRPLVITGVPRTGTTALHKLLSVDPQFQGIELWLSSAPMPRPPREQWSENPYFQAASNGLDEMKKLLPEFVLVHDMVPDEVDECLEILKHSFVSNRWGSTYIAPTYDDYFMKQDERGSYRRYANTLRLIGDNDRDKTWLLKNPGHIWHMDALMEQFPDACIVQTHRDPAKAIPSVCSVIQMTRQLAHGEGADPKMLGAREIDYWARGAERMMRFRQESELDNVHDVVHRDFHADPMGVIQGIYAHFGFELSGTVVDKMHDWIVSHDNVKQHQHQYTAKQFGLSIGQLHERFRDYIERFDLLD